MIELGWCRDTINAGMSRIRRIFKHAIANELIDDSILQRLQCVAPLLAGRTEAHDNAPHSAVESDDIQTVKKLVANGYRVHDYFIAKRYALYLTKFALIG